MYGGCAGDGASVDDDKMVILMLVVYCIFFTSLNNSQYTQNLYEKWLQRCRMTKVNYCPLMDKANLLYICTT